MEKRTCDKCGASVSKTDTWREIDPRTNKPVYVCNGCYSDHQIARVHVLMRVHILARMTTLEMLEICPHTYAYRVTYHLFDDHVQTEYDYDNYASSWVRDAFTKMDTLYDDLSIMDCDIV